MTKAVLFGGGEYSRNTSLIQAALELCHTPIPRVTYIPSCSEYGYEDFPQFSRAFEKTMACTFVYFPIDKPFSERLKREALSSHFVFLSGGNTFSFLRDLRRAGMIARLKEFSKKGGVLGGLSAGAIMLTQTIASASFPPWDCDENEIGLKNWEALKLLGFDFFPHYVSSERNHKYLAKESKKRTQCLIASPDEAGVVIDEDRIQLIGSCEMFVKGHRIGILR